MPTDAIAIRVDGPRAWDEALTVDWRVTDLGETHRATLRNGVLTHRVVEPGGSAADLTLVLERHQLLRHCWGSGSTRSRPRATSG